MDNTNTSSPVASSFSIDEWQNARLLSLLPCTDQELKNPFILNLYLCFCNKNNSSLAHLPLPAPKKKCITFVFYFPWVFQPFQEKLKTLIMQNVFLFWGGGGGGQKRCIMGGVQMANGSFALILLQRQSVIQKGLQHQKESWKPGILLKTKKRNAKCWQNATDTRTFGLMT